MTDELPPLDYVKLAVFRSYPDNDATSVQQYAAKAVANPVAFREIIAHARTIAKHETPPVDPAEEQRWKDAAEAAVKANEAIGLDAGNVEKEEVSAAYIALCNRDGVTPNLGGGK